jgi:TonB family protein
MNKLIFILFFSFSLGSLWAQKEKEDLPDALKARLNSTQAEFPGGYEKMNKFINKQKRYETNSQEEGHVGVVAVSFIVETDGQLDSVQVVQPLTDYYNKEAMRIIKAMPKWKPATQNGKAVRTQLTFPIKF